MDRPLLQVPVGQTAPALAAVLTQHLRAALDGSGPALAPVPAGTSRSLPATVESPVALVVGTSGSTGDPRGVLLDGDALRASARATEARLVGPGRWVLTLPLAHVAGLQVLARSVLAGTEPVVVPADGGFDPTALADAVLAASRGPADLPLYTSLVPTQLHRVVAAAGDAATLPPGLEPLTRIDAVLLGGAATPPALLDRARDLGLRVRTTYGMTETSGGCVYDGVPLDGVRLAVHDDGVHIAGPVLARGYVVGADRAAGHAMTEAAFTTDADGVRWFRTRDLGRVRDGVLHVTGRSDDVLVTGGHKVAPAAVEASLAAQAGVGQVCVVGVPDPEWGTAVTAVVVPQGAPPSLGPLREAVRRTLGDAAAPRHLVLVDALPERGPGKVDRAEVTRRARAAVRSEASAQPPTRTEHHGDTR